MAAIPLSNSEVTGSQESIPAPVADPISSPSIQSLETPFGGSPIDWKLYPLGGYEVVTDNSVKPVSVFPFSDETRRTAAFFAKGMRTTVAAIILTHRWLTPHALLVVKDNKTDLNGISHCGLFSFKAPLGSNYPQVLVEKLNRYIRPPTDLLPAEVGSLSQGKHEVAVGQLIANWWVSGPNDYHHPTPLLPIHCIRPREHIRAYQVVLPPCCTFALPAAYSLKSVPLADLATYTPALVQCIQQLPAQLSRFSFSYFEEGEDDDAAARHFHESTPIGGPGSAGGSGRTPKHIGGTPALRI